MEGQSNTPGSPALGLQSQARGLLSRGRTLAAIGTDVVTSARMAAAIHMAESAPVAQNPRDQAARLRDLVTSMVSGGHR